MACVSVSNVTVLDNPSPFANPFQFEVSFECLAPIADDIEWRLVYVGSAETDQHDQLLDSVLVGPMQVCCCLPSAAPASLPQPCLEGRTGTSRLRLLILPVPPQGSSRNSDQHLPRGAKRPRN